MAATLRIYNTLTRTVEDFVPREPGTARMYVCGMTVYDYCHIGHARAMLTFDVVYRWLVERGLAVTYVRNYTDVDDKIIARAQETGEDALALAARFIAALNEDLERFGLALPQVQPKVSEHIPEILALTAQLIERGHAYAVDGDVYFSVPSFPSYGKLSGKRVDDLRAGERVAVDERKRHPADFALWKSAKPGEVAWESPWGPGRPGWHIECSAMSQRHLGAQFDIHGGGIDLVFPHHENEIAQSECGTGHAPYARYWMHNGHVHLGEAKMSKSIGNVIRIRDLLDEVPAEALRLLYLQTHYRSPLPFSTDRLAEALAGVDRVYTAREALEQMAAQAPTHTVDQLVRDFEDPAANLRDAARAFPTAFGDAMDDDFNTAEAAAVLFDLVRIANRFANLAKARPRAAALAREALACFDLAGRVLGIGGRSSAVWFAEVKQLRLRAQGLTEDGVQSLIDARLAARKAKDWAEADRLRDALAALGIVLMDSPTGTTWRMRIESPEAAPAR